MASEIKVDTIVNAGGDNDSGIDLGTNDQVKVKIAGTNIMTVKEDGELELGTTSSSDSEISFLAATDGASRINFGDSGDADIGVIQYEHDGNNIIFKANASEKMRIKGNSEILFGCTALPSDSVGGAGFEDAGDDRMILNLSTTTTASRNQIVFRNPNNAVGTINTSGTTTGFNTSSDYRLKENVVTDWDATTRLKQLKPSRFNFKADKDTTVDGFLAHEVSSIVPVAISGEKDAVDKEGNPEYQGIDQSKLVPLLTKALQEAVAKIETLEAKVTALESK